MQKSKGNENENEMIRNTKTKTKIVHVEKQQRNKKQFADETTTKQNAKIKMIASLFATNLKGGPNDFKTRTIGKTVLRNCFGMVHL